MLRNDREVSVAVHFSHRERLQSRSLLAFTVCPFRAAKTMTHSNTDPANNENRPPLNKILELPSFPTVHPEDSITDDGDQIIIEHSENEQTKVKLTTHQDGTITISGIIHVTAERPEITPADEVFTLGNTTKIIHGPGRETIVKHKE